MAQKRTMHRWISGVARFRRLPAADRRILARAVARYGVVMCLVRTVGLRRSLALIQRGRKRAREPAPTAARMDVNRFVLAVARAHKAWGRGACLDRALTLCWLLQRSGLPAEVQVGVSRHGDDLTAHAWVHYDGECLGDDGARSIEYASFEAVTP